MTTPPDSLAVLALKAMNSFDAAMFDDGIEMNDTRKDLILAFRQDFLAYRRQVAEMTAENERLTRDLNDLRIAYAVLSELVERVAEWETDNVGLTYYETKEYGKEARELLERKHAPPSSKG